MPIFDDAGCGTLQCHGGVAPKENLDLSSANVAYTELVGVGSNQCNNLLLVDPGSPGTSYLINKLTGTDLCFGSAMPKGAPQLTQAAIDVVRAWIGNQAPNN